MVWVSGIGFSVRRICRSRRCRPTVVRRLLRLRVRWRSVRQKAALAMPAPELVSTELAPPLVPLLPVVWLPGLPSELTRLEITRMFPDIVSVPPAPATPLSGTADMAAAHVYQPADIAGFAVFTVGFFGDARVTVYVVLVVGDIDVSFKTGTGTASAAGSVKGRSCRRRRRHPDRE